MTVDMQDRETSHPAPPERPLRIAMIAPPWFELPPSGYGGIESVVADLVNTLADRGHEITLVGAGRHRTRAARFVAVYPEPPSHRLGAPIPEVITAAHAAAVLDDLDVDVVHDHTLAGPLLARGRDVPTAVTMHGAVDDEFGEYVTRLGDTVDVVAISDAQRRRNPEINWVGRVHNAVDPATFPFRADKDDYVLWLGRFHPDKGAHLAIDAARAAGARIVLAGKRAEPCEHAYFEAEVAPRLGRGVDYVGEADAAQKRRLLAGARTLVFPVQWEEPFGMVLVEAMACGTPVVALRRGSVPEVVDSGVTGLVVDHAEELAAALQAVGSIDPAQCRARVEDRFSLDVMAAGYERIYRALVDGGQEVAGLTSGAVGAVGTGPTRRSTG
jgi:glycosyltransferase involved in cell wall biosynthesis